MNEQQEGQSIRSRDEILAEQKICLARLEELGTKPHEFMTDDLIAEAEALRAKLKDLKKELDSLSEEK